MGVMYLREKPVGSTQGPKTWRPVIAKGVVCFGGCVGCGVVGLLVVGGGGFSGFFRCGGGLGVGGLVLYSVFFVVVGDSFFWFVVRLGVCFGGFVFCGVLCCLVVWWWCGEVVWCFFFVGFGVFWCFLVVFFVVVCVYPMSGVTSIRSLPRT